MVCSFTFSENSRRDWKLTRGVTAGLAVSGGKIRYAASGEVRSSCSARWCGEGATHHPAHLEISQTPSHLSLICLIDKTAYKEIFVIASNSKTSTPEIHALLMKKKPIKSNRLFIRLEGGSVLHRALVPRSPDRNMLVGAQHLGYNTSNCFTDKGKQSYDS